MGKFFDHIPANIIPWIQDQKLFYVATAPLLEDGHVNVSPKGYDETFHIVYDDDGVGGDQKGSAESNSASNSKRTSRAVWYEDLTGTGVETISHVRENGRITIMFVAFEGPPQIIRLFGTGRVYEFGSDEYKELIPSNERLPGSRSIIWVDLHRVGTSCGWSIPFFDYSRPRTMLHRAAAHQEQIDFDGEDNGPTLVLDAPESSAGSAKFEADDKLELPRGGLKRIWQIWNTKSLDGLPALESSFSSPEPLCNWKDKVWEEDDVSIPAKPRNQHKGGRLASTGKVLLEWDLGKALIGFLAGLVVSRLLGRYLEF